MAVSPSTPLLEAVRLIRFSSIPGPPWMDRHHCASTQQQVRAAQSMRINAQSVLMVIALVAFLLNVWWQVWQGEKGRR